jgi:hypothetical protein
VRVFAAPNKCLSVCVPGHPRQVSPREQQWHVPIADPQRSGAQRPAPAAAPAPVKISKNRRVFGYQGQNSRKTVSIDTELKFLAVVRFKSSCFVPLDEPRGQNRRPPPVGMMYSFATVWSRYGILSLSDCDAAMCDMRDFSEHCSNS